MSIEINTSGISPLKKMSKPATESITKAPRPDIQQYIKSKYNIDDMMKSSAQPIIQQERGIGGEIVKKQVESLVKPKKIKKHWANKKK